jgi:hypothetical protein
VLLFCSHHGFDFLCIMSNFADTEDIMRQRLAYISENMSDWLEAYATQWSLSIATTNAIFASALQQVNVSVVDGVAEVLNSTRLHIEQSVTNISQSMEASENNTKHLVAATSDMLVVLFEEQLNNV